MEQNQLAVKMFVMFSLNYPRPEEFVEWICKRVDRGWLCPHLVDKFKHLCEIVGSYGAMNAFYADLDKDLKDALAEYAIKVWAPEGMRLNEEQMKTLEILLGRNWQPGFYFLSLCS